MNRANYIYSGDTDEVYSIAQYEAWYEDDILLGHIDKEDYPTFQDYYDTCLFAMGESNREVEECDLGLEDYEVYKDANSTTPCYYIIRKGRSSVIMQFDTLQEAIEYSKNPLGMVS